MRIISTFVLIMIVVSAQAMDWISSETSIQACSYMFHTQRICIVSEELYFKKAIIRKQPTINRRESFYALFPNDTRVTVDRDFNADDQPIYFGTYNIACQDGCGADFILPDVTTVKMYFDACKSLHTQQEKAQKTEDKK